MGKGGHVNRKEPEGPEIMEAYEDSRYIFDGQGGICSVPNWMVTTMVQPRHLLKVLMDSGPEFQT
jgi:hypothetical protein